MSDPDGSISDLGAFGGPGADGWDLDRDGFYSWWEPGDYDSATYPMERWDCDDLQASVNPGAFEVDGDGVDSNCDGDDDAVCAGFVPGTDGPSGTLDCSVTTFDDYTFPVTAGQCVQVQVDNGPIGAADPSFDIVIGGSTIRRLDQLPCSVEPWNNDPIACANYSTTAPATETVMVRVFQVWTAGCTFGAEYTLNVAVDGEQVIPTLVANDPS